MSRKPRRFPLRRMRKYLSTSFSTYVDEEFKNEFACSTSAEDLWKKIWLRFNFKRELEGDAAKREFNSLKKGAVSFVAEQVSQLKNC